MSTTCNGVTSDFSPGIWNLAGFRVDGTYSATHTFSGDGVDITSDDFVMDVFDADDVLVKSLIIGDGLTINSATELAILIGTPVTDAAGTYTHTITRTENATGAEYIYAEGKIVVKA